MIIPKRSNEVRIRASGSPNRQNTTAKTGWLGKLKVYDDHLGQERKTVQLLWEHTTATSSLLSYSIKSKHW